MGKISSLPDAERMAIIGYLAQEGVIREITAEVPLRRCNEFQSKYGVKPYDENNNTYLRKTHYRSNHSAVDRDFHVT